MKKFLLAVILLSAAAEAGAQTRHWVQFTDKGNSPYMLSNPSAYLSARALNRRTVQNIAIDSLDMPVTPAYVNAVAATGVTVRARSKWLNGVVILTSDTNALNAIAALPFVQGTIQIAQRNAEPDAFDKWAEETMSPAAPSPQRNVSVSPTMLNYGGSFNQIDMIGGVCLHNSGYRGAGMVIAVIDAGFNNVNNMTAFDSLRAHNRILGTWDFVMGDTSVYEDNTHGTYVLSCMGANLPGELVGTAPEASYWLLRSEDAPTENIVEEYFWASAAEYADSVGADVINSSLGYTTFDDPAQNHTYADMDGNTAPSSRAADFAASRGMVVCNSAGNSGSSSWFYIGAPADADSILAVGAVDPAGNYASFSSRGPSADNDVKPDVAAQGQNTVVAGTSGGTFTGNGTSFASPVLCGLVACLWQAHPTMSNVQLMDVIKQSANQYTTPDTYLGYGKPDFCAANLTLSGNPQNLGSSDQLIMSGPNPFGSEMSFSFYSVNNQWLQITITDATGRVVEDRQLFAAGGTTNVFNLSAANYVAEGVYILQVRAQGGNFERKLVKGGQ
ncbi:MAG: S8 family serine peptidase [Bacteroidia bacterium]|nr:S8 family serine peptidase [Bacteroidia bacterium]